MSGLLQGLMRGIGEVVGGLISLFQPLAEGIWDDVFATHDKQIDLAISQRDLFFQYRGVKPPSDMIQNTITDGEDYLVNQYREKLGEKIPVTAFEEIYIYPVSDKKLVGVMEAQAPAWKAADRAYQNVMGQVSSYNVGAAMAHTLLLTAQRTHDSARSINMVDKVEQVRFELFDDAAYARKLQALNVGLTVGNSAVRGQADTMQSLQGQLGALAANDAQKTTDLIAGVAEAGQRAADAFGGEGSKLTGATTGNRDGFGAIELPQQDVTPAKTAGGDGSFTDTATGQ